VNRDEGNAILALKNAWNGAVAATDRLRELAPAVESLPETATVMPLNRKRAASTLKPLSRCRV
jgi:hypothetical protein